MWGIFKVAVATLDFAGGLKLTRALQTMAGRLGTATRVNVGFLEGATYPATSKRKQTLNVATVAFWNEFGRTGQVPRPFFRNMIHAKSPTWGRALAKNLVATHYDAHRTLNLMGAGVKDQLVSSINAFTSPALKASTIRRKGFAKPLIDTALMLNSAGYAVQS